ncbi:DNA/RNA non-specific endonuclease [Hydrogenophilus islandicus]
MGRTRRRSLLWPPQGSGWGAFFAALLFTLVGLWVGAEPLPEDSPYGWPKGGARLATRLTNPGFVISYSEWHGAPQWVAYRADPPPRFRLKPRPEQFEPDWRTWRCRLHIGCVTHQSYSRSGFDRGHMAPNFMIGTRYGEEAQHATFLMSNIAPQRPEHNRGSWERLERLEANRFAPGAAKLWVIVGPVWDEHPARFSHEWIAVPQAFFRVLLREEANGERRVLAFIVPQEAEPDADLRRFLVTVAEVERRTGLVLFPELPDAERSRLANAPPDPDAWGLTPEWATQRPRYTSR